MPFLGFYLSVCACAQAHMCQSVSTGQFSRVRSLLAPRRIDSSGLTTSTAFYPLSHRTSPKLALKAITPTASYLHKKEETESYLVIRAEGVAQSI